jgi:hypothetical protein
MKLKHKTVLTHINTVVLSCLSVDGNTFRLLLGYHQGIQHRILERKTADERDCDHITDISSSHLTELFRLRTVQLTRPQRCATLVPSVFNLGEAPFRAGDMCVCACVCATIVLQEVKRDKHVTVHALLVFWKSQVCWWKILNRLVNVHTYIQFVVEFIKMFATQTDCKVINPTCTMTVSSLHH